MLASVMLDGRPVTYEQAIALCGWSPQADVFHNVPRLLAEGVAGALRRAGHRVDVVLHPMLTPAQRDDIILFLREHADELRVDGENRERADECDLLADEVSCVQVADA